MVHWVRRTHSSNTVTSATDLSVSVRAQLCHSERVEGSSFCMFLAGFFCHGTNVSLMLPFVAQETLPKDFLNLKIFTFWINKGFLPILKLLHCITTAAGA